MEPVFKRKTIRLPWGEKRKLVNNLLKEHPEGLTRTQIAYLLDINKRNMYNILKRLVKQPWRMQANVYERKISDNTNLYYAMKHSITVAKKVKETQEIIKQIKQAKYNER